MMNALLGVAACPHLRRHQMQTRPQNHFKEKQFQIKKSTRPTTGTNQRRWEERARARVFRVDTAERCYLSGIPVK
jgi:hypothetical protein